MSITKRLISFSSIIYILILLTLGIFAFSKTFHLALFGDEWYVIWMVKNSIMTNGQWDLHLNQAHLLGYKTGALIMYLLTEYFGYDGKAVYIFSFTTRFFAALTLYYFLRKRECSNTSSFLGTLLFLITPIGLQATDWATNFTSYMSIIFFLLCINSIYTLKSWKNILIFLTTFAISIYINPIRAPGIILTISFLLIFQYFLSSMRDRGRVIFSLFCSLALIFIFSKMFTAGINIPPQPIEKLLGAAGATLLPQITYYYTGLLIATLLLWKRYLFAKKYLLFTLALHIPIIPIFFGSFLQISNNRMFTILGIYFTLFMISTFIIELSSRKMSEASNTILLFLLSICFLIAPLLAGTLVIDPTHRYFIYSALSVPIIAAFSFNQSIFPELKEKSFSLFKLSSISFCITLLFIMMFFLSLKSEINELYLHHNQDTTNLLWQQITPYFNNYDFKNHTPVVFFDTNNGAIVHDTVSFGFGYHMGYIYKIWVSDIKELYNRLPVAVDSLTDFTSLITDGKASKKYLGQDSKLIFPKEDSFYFKIDGLKVSRIKDY